MMGKTRPNEQLADVMHQVGVSNKTLARLVREASGGAVNSDHTSVSRWLAGMQPRTQTALVISQVLGEKAGRTVSLEEIGMSATDTLDPNIGLEYGETVDSAASSLGRLWRADLDEVRAILSAQPNNSSWADAPLSWLVRTGSGPVIERQAGVRVGRADVERISATSELFAQLDNRFGGGHARRALIQYLHEDLRVLLAGRCDEATSRGLYSAAAEATLLAAWMSYDAGIHGIAQRYFVQALRLAHAGEDVQLAGSILDAMSHQATFLGRHREAVNLARAARAGTTNRATATLTAHFYAMEARALAFGGDTIGAHRALSDAVRVFERRTPGNDPEWISYFDDAELAAEFSHCFRDIGRSQDAVTYAGRSLVAAGTSARSDFFVMMVLAAGHLGQGEVEEACRVAAEALDQGVQLKSARCIEYVRQFRRQLSRYGKSAAVRALSETGERNALWRSCEPLGLEIADH